MYWRSRALEQALLSGASVSSAAGNLASSVESVGGSSADRDSGVDSDQESEHYERELSQSVTDVWNSLLPAYTPSAEKS